MAGPYPKDALERLSTLTDKQVLVTGGCGFLGRHIVELLLEVGAKVRVFDIVIRSYSEDVEFVKGDLMNTGDIEAACKGCYVIFHTASPSPVSRNAKLFYNVNVKGTQNVLDACDAVGVNRMVHTSTASIVFDGTDQENLDETHPLPKSPMDDYTHSKQLAEKTALQNSGNALVKGSTNVAVCAIRPHSIFGPRDPHFVPALAKAGVEGKSKWIIGGGENIVDFTYVGNVAYAHLLAACHLGPKSKLNGQAYFITNDEPVKFWDFVGEIQVGLGNMKPYIRLPYRLMLFIATILTAISNIIPSFKPLFNLQSVTYAGCHHYYSCQKAKQDFDYRPPISLDEAKRRNLESFKHLYNTKSQQKKGGYFGIIVVVIFVMTALYLLIK